MGAFMIIQADISDPQQFMEYAKRTPALVTKFGGRYRVRIEDTGAQTRIRAKVWEDGTGEPAGWQADAVDESATRLTGGSVGLWSFYSGSKRWDDLAVEPLTP